MPFPDICYSSISYEVQPDIARTVYHSHNTRQRRLRQRHEPRYSVSIQLDSAKLTEFEDFITTEAENGASEFQGPYFDGFEQTGTLQIINGEYRVSYLASDWWNLSYSFEVKNRDMTDAEAVYDLVNAAGGFDDLEPLFDALEDLVNFHGLDA